ncbi:MAG TPA: hypothetical protein VNC50_20915 [Planctomycetia bacterium]|nr:hypothetical protein [Planctomycetia bacterium]
MSRRPVARWWALGALAVVWNGPWVARQFVAFPLGPVWATVSFGLAAIILAAWLLPGMRRIVFRPDAPEQSEGCQVVAIVIGFVAAGLFLFVLGPLGALAALE